MKIQIVILPLLMLFGCTTTQPKPAAPTKPPLSLSEAQQDIEQAKGRSILWGGTIASIRNLTNGTQLEIVARDLGRHARPRDVDHSDGRFRANVTGFLEPQTYAPGREVTVSGQLVASETGVIGEYAYTFPLIAADNIKLWQQRQEDPHTHSHAYDPLFFPWGFSHPRRHFGVPLHERLDH